MTQGRFITFEGGEGSGKSTQAHLLQQKLGEISIEAVLTREPGGSPGAEEIRHLLMRGESERWSPLSETMLLYAARADHLMRTIRPSLRRGYWVISDRFADSSHAYQGAASGVSTELLDQLDAAVVESTRPELTVILDIPADIGLKRAERRQDEEEFRLEDRFERRRLDFHERLRQGFLEVAERSPERCVVIDGLKPAEEVAALVWHAVQTRLLETE
ncbi:MAG: dTMP kinase [Hyphomicrobiales bacterium]|nr:MAG: dTMP kinase [Hyphomicrobiales bacterium]